jgi:hypothetical protein
MRQQLSAVRITTPSLDAIVTVLIALMMKVMMMMMTKVMLMVMVMMILLMMKAGRRQLWSIDRLMLLGLRGMLVEQER